MHLSHSPYFLEFKHPFGLAHGTRTHTPVVYARIENDSFVGYGEAALPPYLPETQRSVVEFFNSVKEIFKTYSLKNSIPEIHSKINSVSKGNSAAKAALDIALHDLFGKFQRKPVYEILGVNKPVPKSTFVTISIGEIKIIAQKIEELSDFTILKIKLGGGNDKEIIEAVRKCTAKPIAVDVNQGWTNKIFALEMIEWLRDKNVLFIEQPLEKNNLEDAKWLMERSPLPIIADESFQGLSDLGKISSCFHGINLKLMKCGGLSDGVKIIRAAKEKKLKINLGCMSESSCGIAAAAQLMNEVDWVDLDGPVLIKNDPFNGIKFSEGKIFVNDAPGLGIEPTVDLNFV